MDPARGVCLGCCRTLEEIAAWAGMDDAEQARVLAQLPERRARLNVPEIPVPPLA
jgi:predicted Fe-S protein YdhL (DUF1289 family)